MKLWKSVRIGKERDCYSRGCNSLVGSTPTSSALQGNGAIGSTSGSGPEGYRFDPYFPCLCRRGGIWQTRHVQGVVSFTLVLVRSQSPALHGRVAQWIERRVDIAEAGDSNSPSITVSPRRLGVRTRPFQGRDTSSNLVEGIVFDFCFVGRRPLEAVTPVRSRSGAWLLIVYFCPGSSMD